MPIKMLCPNCRTPLNIADKLAGRSLSCPKCSAQLNVPGGAPAAPQPAQPKAPEDDLQLFMPGQGARSHEDKTSYKRCPGCGRDVEVSTKLCTGCGYNFDTGKTLKGHVISEPGAWKRYAETILRNGFFIVIFIVGAYGIYYVATKTDFLRDIQKNPTDLKDQPGQGGQPQPGGTAEAPQSLLLVTNARFGKLEVFSNGEKIGQVEHGKTAKFRFPAPASDKPLKITFEAKLAAGAQLDDKTKQALDAGLAFGGTPAEGLRLEFKGPPAGLLPEPDEALKGLAVGTHVSRDAATGLGFCKEIPYKDSLLKPVPPLASLRVTWKDAASGPTFAWIAQDCVVERDGKAAYTPPSPTFEASKIKLTTKDGKVDVQP